MSEFERIKQEISGHGVTITSWYDSDKQTWRASAPAYAHLFSLSSTLPLGCASRKQAIERIIGILTSHFHDRSPSTTG